MVAQVMAWMGAEVKSNLRGASNAGRGRAGERRFQGRDDGMKAGGGGAPATGTTTSPQAATPGRSSGVVAGLSVS